MRVARRSLVVLTMCCALSASIGVAGAGATPHYYENGLTEAAALPAGEKVQVVSWGWFTITPEAPSTAPPTTCEAASGGYVENPGGLAGAAGRGQTQGFTAWNCAGAGCPAGLVEFPAKTGKSVEKEALILPGGQRTSAYDIVGSLPWPSELIEPKLKKIRSEMKGVALILACVAQTTVEGYPPLGDGDKDSPQLLAPATLCFTTSVNRLTPLYENGTQIGGPNTSRLFFDAESGNLACKGPGEKEGTEIEFTASLSGKLHTMTSEGQNLVYAH